MSDNAAVTDPDIREIKSIVQRLESLLKQMDNRLNSMDSRLNSVELRITGLETKTLKLIEDLAELKGRVSQLPSTIVMIGFVAAVLGAAGFLRYFGPR